MSRLAVAFLAALCGACIARSTPLWIITLCGVAAAAFAIVDVYATRRDLRIQLAEARREASDATAGVYRGRIAALLDGLRSKAIPAGLRGHGVAVVEMWAEKRAGDRTQGYLKALDDAGKAFERWES